MAAAEKKRQEEEATQKAEEYRNKTVVAKKRRQEEEATQKVEQQHKDELVLKSGSSQYNTIPNHTSVIIYARDQNTHWIYYNGSVSSLIMSSGKYNVLLKNDRGEHGYGQFDPADVFHNIKITPRDGWWSHNHIDDRTSMVTVTYYDKESQSY